MKTSFKNSNLVNEFYDSIKNKSNVLSADEVYNKRDSVSFFSSSIWQDKIFLNKFLDGRNLRTLNPVIFGLKSGICFKCDEVYFITGKGSSEYWSLQIPWSSEHLKISGSEIFRPGYNYTKGGIFTQEDINIFNDFIKILEQINENAQLELERKSIEQNTKEKFRLEELIEIKKLVLNELDKDNNGELDLIENGFNNLFSKNQKLILDLNKIYIHQFVKVSNFIKTKKQNTQRIFETIRDTSSRQELEERVNLLKNQIHAYELLVFHSINMIGALVTQDLITFYEIYESFDKLGVFNSNWENEVSEKLTNIGDKLDDLMYSIYNMEQNIVSELSHLSYVTQESFEDLNRSVTSQLKEVESSINTNNLLTGIQAYQLYKINKNTKGLRG